MIMIVLLACCPLFSEARDSRDGCTLHYIHCGIWLHCGCLIYLILALACFGDGWDRKRRIASLKLVFLSSLLWGQGYYTTFLSKEFVSLPSCRIDLDMEWKLAGAIV